ncbi:SGNH/GDSL hydrolase family protein [Cerasicoccus arenae]|uniref:SGNH hydrolase-type esterase domain-containing protein n=1 Tax=Cerasicoccus arenae TaxID=424488 RepID=A0A8J3D9P6_9BACT|nr:SGNH/GDSL hydrolase family protein [Cerasicoccus arenae]MBK1857088.1 SGNH/GDSL hydrolase family protein [Cerasicoccus arenae]GHB92293.1 hypothetical protein GCM10007047_04210 [Cerasicoccus arenae]
MSHFPEVLIIGDSISIGYTPFVEKAFLGRANVSRNEGNASSTIYTLEHIDAWLGDTHWDVIHFNWGLHDLKFVDEDLTMVSVSEGRQLLSLDDYEKNLRVLVARLQKTGAKLIWAMTTPIPEGVSGRIPGDEIAYNAVARKVMEETGVAISDLYAVMAEDRGNKGGKVADVHYTDEGSELLSRQVIQYIEDALK